MGSRIAQPTIVDGVRYRSKFEAETARSLARSGVKWEYEGKTIPYEVTRVYVTDFTIIRDGEPDLYIETKGYLDAEDRRKLREIKDQHPKTEIRLLFQNPNARISRESKTTYAQWAERNGFKWAKGPAVPEAWLDEWRRL